MIRVLLVDANQDVRNGLAALLQTEPDIEVVGQVMTGAYALLLAQYAQPDFVLLDLQILIKDVAVVGHIKKLCPQARIFITATQYDGTQVQQAIRAGAAGFLPKPIAVPTLFRMIRQQANVTVLAESG